MDDDSRGPDPGLRSTLAVLGLAALAASAGCMGVLGGNGGSTPTATPDAGEMTATPTATPDDEGQTATATPTTTDDGDGNTTSGDLPPGITSEGTFNPTALLIAHKQQLSGASYTIEIRVARTIRTSEGTRNSTDRQITRVGGDGRFVTRLVRRARIPLLQSTWGNDSVAVARQRIGNRTRYRRPDVEQIRGNLTGQGFVQRFIELGNYSVERIDRSSNRVFLSAAAAPEDAGLGPNVSVASYEGTLVVDFQGRIRQLTTNVTVETNTGDTAELAASYRLSSVGETTVERPDWVETALEETESSESGRLDPV